jgi:hypothetical protein
MVRSRALVLSALGSKQASPFTATIKHAAIEEHHAATAQQATSAHHHVETAREHGEQADGLKPNNTRVSQGT